MENCNKEIEHYLSQNNAAEESKKMMKKIRKQGSYLSMENLDVGDDEEFKDDEEEDEKESRNIRKKKSSIMEMPDLKVNSENIILHPVYILEKAFSKVTAVGSSTAMVGIRN